MQYYITETEQFEKDLRFYVKKRKCKNLIGEVRELKGKLENGDFVGDEINGIGLPDGENSYKLRMADTTHGIGTRGGFRLIYYVIKNEMEVFLLTIYSKRDKSDIPKNELRKLIEEYCSKD